MPLVLFRVLTSWPRFGLDPLPRYFLLLFVLIVRQPPQEETQTDGHCSLFRVIKAKSRIGATFCIPTLVAATKLFCSKPHL